MIIFDKNYKVDPHKLVDDLAKVFNFNGLDDKKVTGQYFLCCPFHAGGHEKTASANFSLQNKGRAKEGDFYCFACKTKGHISSVLIKLFGDSLVARDWVERMYGNLRGLVEESREIKKIEVEKPTEEKDQVFELFEEAYLVGTTYYANRGIPEELVEKFRFGYLEAIELLNRKREKYFRYSQAYFPVFNKEGRVVFFQLRSTKTKSFYLPVDSKKVIWGANWVTDSEIVVCESIFNAATCWKFGRQAVAMFGSGDEAAYQQLLELPCRSYVLALDPDEAGLRGTEEAAKALRASGRLVSTVTIDEAGKDINDFAKLSKGDFDSHWNKWLKRGI